MGPDIYPCGSLVFSRLRPQVVDVVFLVISEWIRSVLHAPSFLCANWNRLVKHYHEFFEIGVPCHRDVVVLEDKARFRYWTDRLPQLLGEDGSVHQISPIPESACYDVILEHDIDRQLTVAHVRGKLESLLRVHNSHNPAVGGSDLEESVRLVEWDDYEFYVVRRSEFVVQHVAVYL